MLISNKLHSFRNFWVQKYKKNIVPDAFPKKNPQSQGLRS